MKETVKELQTIPTEKDFNLSKVKTYKAESLLPLRK